MIINGIVSLKKDDCGLLGEERNCSFLLLLQFTLSIIRSKYSASETTMIMSRHLSETVEKTAEYGNIILMGWLMGGNKIFLFFLIVLLIVFRDFIFNDNRKYESRKNRKIEDDCVSVAKAAVRKKESNHRTIYYSKDSDLYQSGEEGLMRRQRIERQNDIILQKCQQKSKSTIEDASREYSNNKEKYLALDLIEKSILLENLKNELGIRVKVTEYGFRTYDLRRDRLLEDVRFEDYQINPVESITKRCALVYAWLDLVEKKFYESFDKNRECYLTVRRELLFSYTCGKHKEHTLSNKKVSKKEYCLEEKECTVLEEQFIPSQAEGIIRFEKVGDRRSDYMDL